jgi:molybdate transport system substrate-binding protein
MRPMHRSYRRGLALCSGAGARVQLAGVVFLGSLALLLVCVGFLLRNPDRSAAPARGPLVVYCAAAVKGPVEAVAREYERTCGVPVQLSFGASQTLLTGAEISGRGDLFIPADDSFLAPARQKAFVAETIPLARLGAVVAVAKGNPKVIRSLDDLLQPGLKLAQANPDAAAIGRLTREALGKAGRWDALQKQTLVFKPTVSDVANDVKLGSVDAGIIWDGMARQYPDLDMVSVPELSAVKARVALGVLRGSPQPTAALRFARYLAARDKGLTEFARQGFDVVEGDPWAEQPEVLLYSGAMLRPAIDETIQAFEQREGVRVTRVYNGCGILVAQMRAEARPDAYFACDASFMGQVKDLFLDAADVSVNQLVILVPKGNPRGIKTLKDLGQPDLRLGVGHEKQCALGVLTRNTLLTNGVYGEVMKNVKVQSPTGDFLVNQLRTRSLDVVIAYISNATPARDELDAIPIDIPCAYAVQPVALAREAKHKQIASRLLEALTSQPSRERFESNGFRWKFGAPAGTVKQRPNTSIE